MSYKLGRVNRSLRVRAETSHTWNQFHSIAPWYSLAEYSSSLCGLEYDRDRPQVACSDLVLRDIMPDRSRRPNSARAERVAICDFALHATWAVGFALVVVVRL